MWVNALHVWFLLSVAEQLFEDYSRFDNIDCSSSEEEVEDEEFRRQVRIQNQVDRSHFREPEACDSVIFHFSTFTHLFH